jgi:mannose/cellobiose epimerase-like protein (N-acyl-D-glucosamine 2-epimerase family)
LHWRTALLALVLGVLAPLAVAQPAPRVWLDHVEHDLAGLWMQDALAGDSPGSFPTFVCADGRPYRGEACPGFAPPPAWIRPELGRQYIRMLSRQVYTYGVIYHLTGNETALARARAGTRFIMERAWDPATGSVATYLADGKPGPDPDQRSTQSLAYALLGPAFYYYLTRDAQTLAFIESVRRHIFERYWSNEWDMLRWTLADAGEDTADRKELVAQLDQINAYLLLMLPLLDETARPAWERDLRRIVGVLLRDFHDARARRFYGYLHEEKGRLRGERHNDYGHTVKAYWMLLLAGEQLREPVWVALARAGIDDVLRSALVRRNLADAPAWQLPAMRGAADLDGNYHVWANQPDGIGIAWWEWCELDQAAATRALAEPRYLDYLDKTLPTYFAALVDPLHGGTYAFPGRVDSAKAHHWMNGYHAAEHALVGYITSAMQRGEPFRLYFAFAGAQRDAVAPAYFYAAPERGRRALEGLPGGLRKLRVAYAPR